MALISYPEFKTTYQTGYGLNTSTLISDAYREYQISGILPIAIGGTTPTTTTTPTTPTTTTTPTTPTTTTTPTAPTATAADGGYTSLAGVESPTPAQLEAAGFGQLPPPTVAPPEGHPAWADPQTAGILTGLSPGDPLPAGCTTPGCGADGMPTFGGGAAAGIPTPTITPAPAYEISPEQQEMQDLLATTLTDWVTSGGYGLSPEVQAQMIQQQTDTLKAREQENIRVMTNNMERRGITNSGYLQANTNQITSNTTVALAGAIADVQIKSALMKMASFEKAMGAAAQFLGYLSEQSQLQYAPEFATWQAEQLATMQVWQGKLDVYKMELNQAYQTQNITLTAQLQGQLNAEQNAFTMQLEQMKIDAANDAAESEGFWSTIGTILGFGLSFIF